MRRMRDELRRTISPRYSGGAHFAFTTLSSLGATVALAAAAVLRGARPLDWLAFPITLIACMLGEYCEHRWLLHRRTKLAPFAFRIHTLEHHVFFTETDFRPDDRRDFAFVLFPPGLVLGYLFGFVPLFGVIGWLLISPSVGLLVASATAFFFFAYEMIHFGSHIGTRWPFFRWLAEHHRIHHRTELMTTRNFNVVFPLFDWIFGTRVAK